MEKPVFVLKFFCLVYKNKQTKVEKCKHERRWKKIIRTYKYVKIYQKKFETKTGFSIQVYLKVSKKGERQCHCLYHTHLLIMLFQFSLVWANADPKHGLKQLALPLSLFAYLQINLNGKTSFCFEIFLLALQKQAN